MVDPGQSQYMWFVRIDDPGMRHGVSWANRYLKLPYSVGAIKTGNVHHRTPRLCFTTDGPDRTDDSELDSGHM